MINNEGMFLAGKYAGDTVGAVARTEAQYIYWALGAADQLALTARQIDVLKGALAPEMVVPPLPAAPPLPVIPPLPASVPAIPPLPPIPPLPRLEADEPALEGTVEDTTAIVHVSNDGHIFSNGLSKVHTADDLNEMMEIYVAPPPSRPKIEWTREQLGALDQIDSWLDGGGPKFYALTGPAGCHAFGQKLLMYDGSEKAVQDIEVGDLLMGPDSRPRNVLRLVRGRGRMVRITPTKGASFEVDTNHVLTLSRSYGNGPETIDVSVAEWCTWGSDKKKRYKLWRTGVEFDVKRKFVIDPYFLGVLIGDGNITSSIVVAKPDAEIKTECQKQAVKHGMKFTEWQNHTGCPHYGLRGLRRAKKANPLINELRVLGLMGKTSGDKFVPCSYKIASRHDRLELLAGLLDTDGHMYSDCCFEISSKSLILANDICFVARSLGLAAYVDSALKKCQTGAVDMYHRVSISGHCSEVPTRIERKKAKPRKQIKSVNRTGFFVSDLLEDDFYGFTVTGDGRYLMDDFTVTHNCGKSTLIEEIVDRYPHATLTAMTGKAALRLEECAGRAASTLHKVLYFPPKPGEDVRFTRLREPPSSLIVVDESSMVSPGILEHLKQWAEHYDTKFLLVGDSYQLPPVITGEEMRKHGCEDYSVFSIVGGTALQTVMRNAGGVLQAATHVRETGSICEESIPDATGGYEYAREQRPIERAVEEYLADPDDHLVITWKNASRMSANKMIRQMLGHEGPLPDEGEPVLFKKNGQDHLNGEIVPAGEFTAGPTIADMRTLWMTIKGDPTGQKILVSVDGGDKEKGGEWFDGGLPWVADFRKFHAQLKVGGYPEPLPITFGYCLTAHSAQGSQARRVTVFLDREDLRNKHFRKATTLPTGKQAPFSSRFIYTATTRSRLRTTMIVGR